MMLVCRPTSLIQTEITKDIHCDQGMKFNDLNYSLMFQQLRHFTYPVKYLKYATDIHEPLMVNCNEL